MNTRKQPMTAGIFRRRCSGMLAAATLLMPLLSYGDTFTVNTTADGTAVNTLRGAITTAENEAGGTHVINVAAGTYNLTMGEISFGNFPETIQIVGAGAGSTIINMTTTGQDRIFLINPSGAIPDVSVSITGVSFTNGVLTSDNFGGGAILCGGPTNTVNLENCAFKSNSTNSGSGVSGGALAIEGGGTISISGCTFTGNTESASNGGAIFYFLPNSVSGSLSITNSTFTGNTVTGSGTSGGAIYVSVQGQQTGYTSAISITGNSFTDNQAMAAGGLGGAIGIDNEFSSGNFADINYNRFYANKANAIPDVAVTSAVGNVDLTNNWWGTNSSPVSAGDPHAAITGSGGSGSMLYSPWLRLSSTSSAAAVCSGSGSSSVVTAGFTVNSAGITISSANLTALVAVPVSFTTTLGTLSNAQSTTQSDAAATVGFQSSDPTGAILTADVQATADSVTTTDATARTLITVSPVDVLAAISTSGSVTASSSDPVITNANCGQICYVVPAGAQPISGTVNASVTLDPSVQSYNSNPYVTRHYDIEPVTEASSATATVTLYFEQSEFNAYNAALTNTAYELPTGPTDVVGMANLTVNQFHGTGTAPGNYSGWAGTGPAEVSITPGQTNVVWNSGYSYWAVTFPVTGFSGFFITGSGPVTLPVVLESFTGNPKSGGVQLSWAVNDQIRLSYYQVQTSTDATNFIAIGNVTASTSSAGSYTFFQSNPAPGANYYRLKMVSMDGSFTYSNVIEVNVTGAGTAVQVLNNPFTSSCSIKITAARAGSMNLRMTTLSGSILWEQSETLSAGVNLISLPQTQALAQGIYLLSVTGSQVKQTIKLVKID